MSISYAGSGTPVIGTGGSLVLSPVPPTSGADHRNLLIVAWKDTSIPVPVVAATGNWTLLGTAINSVSVSTGADVGGDSVAVWYSDGTAPTGTTVTFTGTVGQAQAVISNFTKGGVTDLWTHEVATGEDTTIGANFSGAATTNPLCLPGDQLVAVVGLRTDGGTQSANSLVAAGLSLGTTTLRVDSSSSVGDDGRLQVVTASVNSGTESGVPTYTYTNSDTAQAGVVLYIRLTTGKNVPRTTGTVVTGSGSNPVLSPVAPTTIGVSGHTRSHLVVAWKAGSVHSPVVASASGTWILGSVMKNNVDVASSPDVGSMGLAVWYADGIPPTSTTVTFTGAVGSCQAAIFNMEKDPTTIWINSYATGEDNSYGANYSATGTSNFLAQSDDVVYALMATDTDVATPTDLNVDIPGVIQGFVAVRMKSISSTGDDSSLFILSSTITDDTQSGGPTASYTLAGSSQGVSIFLRARAISPPVLAVDVLPTFSQSVGYQIEATGLLAFDNWNIYREDQTGFPASDIRGGQFQATAGDSVILQDFEFRFGSTDVKNSANLNTWTLDVYHDSTLVTSVSVSRTPISDWVVASLTDQPTSPPGALARTFLSVPDEPALNIAVAVSTFDTSTYDSNILSNSHILGRSNPVVSIDYGTGQKAEITLLIPDSSSYGGNSWVGSVQASSRLRDYKNLLLSGQILMLRNIQPLASGNDDFYFVADSVTIERMNKVIDLNGEALPIITVKFSVIEVDRPPVNSVVTTNTWQQVKDSHTSWQDVFNNYTSWLGVLQHPSGG